MTIRTLFSVSTLSLSLIFTGCGDSGTTDEGTPSGSEDASSTAGGEGSDDAMGAGEGSDDAAGAGEGNEGAEAAACELIEVEHSASLGDECDDAACPCGSVVNIVTGVIQDASGAPVAGAKAQIRTRSARDLSSVCLTPVDAAADGTLAVNVPADNNCLYEGVLRALAPGQSFSTAYCTYDLAEEREQRDPDLSNNPAVLHATQLATDLPAECVGQARMESTDSLSP